MTAWGPLSFQKEPCVELAGFSQCLVNRAVQYSTKIVFMSRKSEVVPALATKACRGTSGIPPYILSLGSRGGDR